MNADSAPRHYLCFATNQPLINLTPVAGGCVSVAGITILSWPKNRDYAQWLQTALGQVTGRRVPIAIAEVHDGYDIALCRQSIAGIAASHPEGCVANVTGGSKVMALAAWEVLNRPQDALCYVDPNTDELRWLRPDLPTIQIPDRLSLAVWLSAFGFASPPDSPLSRPDSRRLEAAAQSAHSRAEKIAAAYRDGKRVEALELSTGPGQWLETYLAYTLAHLFSGQPSLASRIHDISGPFKVYRLNNRSVTNELDGALLYNNRLFIFEAKNGHEAQGRQAVDAIFRLGQLRQQIGGWLSCGVFIASRQNSDVIKARASELGVHVIDGPQLPKLRSHIEGLLQRPVRG